MTQQKLAAKEPYAIAYHGNVVDLLEYLYEHGYPCGPDERPDLLPRALRRRLLPPGPDLSSSAPRCWTGTPRASPVLVDRTLQPPL